MGYPHPGMFMGYGMDMGYRGRGRGPIPMHPGRFTPAAYGYGYYGYGFPPAFAPPFAAGRMAAPGRGQIGGRGFIAERRPPPGTPGVSSGLQVILILSTSTPPLFQTGHPTYRLLAQVSLAHDRSNVSAALNGMTTNSSHAC